MTDFGCIGCCAPAALITGYSMPPVFSSTGGRAAPRPIGWMRRGCYALMALGRGESRVCRVVRVPSVAQEDARRRSRERTRLVVERGQHSNRIKGVLMTLGVRDFEPTRRDWQERLGALRTADGQELPACLKAEITRECRRLHQVIVMIAEVEAEQAAALDAEEGQAARLIRLRGIGLASATVLADEVFFAISVTVASFSRRSADDSINVDTGRLI